ncbi:SDR family NAD(P)-dependent oxidoreductase [Streptomyces sp. NPDC058401]|uniref:SDR family NAD(P)-dependent oxidoreductase n=1 Tax=Streptomyces sp. NPDC058401 TaxID=3346480 RepID=UPI0036498269
MSTPQQPLAHNPFDAASTAEDVIEGIDLSGRTAVVTGGHSGIGLETARVLRAAGARVVVPVRHPDRAAEALAAVGAVDGVQIERLDLIDPASVDAFAERFLATGSPLHILVNSAGIMAVPLARDARGCESHFATNHLGHHQLAARLRPALARAAGARVVAVSAAAHRMCGIDFEDPQFERREYLPMLGYGQSKTANILFARELDRRGRGEGIRGFSLHPGAIIDTNLSRYTTPESLRAMGLADASGRAVVDPHAGKKTVQQGASTTVWCATSPLLDGMGGVYCRDNDITTVGEPDPATLDARNHRTARAAPPAGLSPHAADPEAAARLWELSDRLAGITR